MKSIIVLSTAKNEPLNVKPMNGLKSMMLQRDKTIQQSAKGIVRMLLAIYNYFFYSSWDLEPF